MGDDGRPKASCQDAGKPPSGDAMTTLDKSTHPFRKHGGYFNEGKAPDDISRVIAGRGKK